MLTHYFDISPNATLITFELYGRTLIAIHLACVEGAEIAVDWPDWKDDEGNFGDVMRVFGSPEGLTALTEKISVLVECKLIRCGDLKPVPEHAESTWMYVRDRNSGRNTPSSKRRIVRRAAARGEIANPITQEITSTHWLPMQSFSSNNSFRMDIKRVPATASDRHGFSSSSSYGLGIPVPSFKEA